jgi:hypothetical protein
MIGPVGIVLVAGSREPLNGRKVVGVAQGSSDPTKLRKCCAENRFGTVLIFRKSLGLCCEGSA